MQPTRLLLKRSTWKGPNLVPLPITWPKAQGDKVPPVRTNARAATILPSFVGLRFEVHNGKTYHRVTITEDMVGHKLGEFSPYAIS
ncbi:37S ribosomal protein-like protein [Hapsidospora chrysogenum ATCC 11550]|uniref:37S ribosomal protein-like protein n=1 Tax=Hapsidospora chrysogenum (strain ATCC 11550 / CBS 779.69 / DSM 880 / IAM 14645 / JCM 23072 / IMI 49137) TaxID=857340 RepID=A0A086TGN0_HAPC1|nr:37S ribosomal protein-like protein [Hapsidospora chrysogenum ATCC 11550]